MIRRKGLVSVEGEEREKKIRDRGEISFLCAAKIIYLRKK